MSYESELLRLCESDPRIVVMTAETRAAIRNLPDILGPRFLDVGICEMTMVGMAAGLALRGRIPVIHALATFLTLRAFEFIRTDVGIARLPVKLIGAVPGFLSDGNGPTHQALEDVALMRGIPGMSVVCPADEEELVAALPDIIRMPGPVYVRYNARPAAVQHQRPYAIGEGEVLATGDDVTLLTYGLLVEEAARACGILEAQGYGVTLINLRTLAPLDAALILRWARATKLVVTIEDHFRIGGLSSMVTETLFAARVQTPVLAISMDERWFHPALLPDVLAHEGFDGPQLAERVRAAIGGDAWRTASA